ncbi:ATP-binding protein [Verrucomicrobia bacterium]|nr:ATP-binding protein [Verrucomicrobiota bacterium]
MKNPRSSITFGILIGIWGLILVWQYFEHQRVVESARQALIGRAVDISTSVGVVIRSQRRFSGIVTLDRLESALAELVRSEDLNGVSLLNTQGEIVAASGVPPHTGLDQLEAEGQIWSEKSVSIVNFVDLGQVSTDEEEGSSPIIVLSSSAVQEEFRNQFSRRRRRDPSEETKPDRENSPNLSSSLPSSAGDTNRIRRGRNGRRPLIDPDRLQELLKTQSLHRFALVLPTQSIQQTMESDRWYRLAVAALAFLALGGSALTWKSVVQSSQLQLRLVRAKELNEYLQEMNLAAAGLAHETRNPLNLIRGMAQMISKTPETSEKVRERSQQITQEVDRVTDQLNDFINYSKPRETRITPVDLKSICRDVMRTLSPDIEDKSIQWHISGPNSKIDADEQMLRQVLFNLLINAAQVVEEKGTIRIRMETDGQNHATLEIQDDGPGVPNAIQADIFKPYFTSHDRGTGLGLAIVHQIVLAHDWDIDYIDTNPSGATFRVSRLVLSNRSRT